MAAIVAGRCSCASSAPPRFAVAWCVACQPGRFSPQPKNKAGVAGSGFAGAGRGTTTHTGASRAGAGAGGSVKPEVRRPEAQRRRAALRHRVRRGRPSAAVTPRPRAGVGSSPGRIGRVPGRGGMTNDSDRAGAGGVETARAWPVGGSPAGRLRWSRRRRRSRWHGRRDRRRRRRAAAADRRLQQSAAHECRLRGGADPELGRSVAVARRRDHRERGRRWARRQGRGAVRRQLPRLWLGWDPGQRLGLTTR